MYLRGSRLKTGSVEYNKLPARLKKRAYHPKMHTKDAMIWEERELRRALGTNGSCNQALAGRVLRAIGKRFEVIGDKVPNESTPRLTTAEISAADAP